MAGLADSGNRCFPEGDYSICAFGRKPRMQTACLSTKTLSMRIVTAVQTMQVTVGSTGMSGGARFGFAAEMLLAVSVGLCYMPKVTLNSCSRVHALSCHNGQDFKAALLKGRCRNLEDNGQGIFDPDLFGNQDVEQDSITFKITSISAGPTRGCDKRHMLCDHRLPRRSVVCIEGC